MDRPLRTKSAFDAYGSLEMVQRAHSRHKSTATVASTPDGAQPMQSQFDGGLDDAHTSSRDRAPHNSIHETAHLEVPTGLGIMSPPITAVQGRSRASSDESEAVPEVTPYDFAMLDYELGRARVLGRGLWSIVLLADARYAPPGGGSLLTPPTSPQKRYQVAPSSVFAVKTPARPDAKDVFQQEAKVLTHVMRKPGATQYIVAFQGLDARNHALVFEAVIGGSLESLNSRLKQLTEVSRHVELVSLFPGLADDLVSGLEFLHAADVVHADIKPANVLLDISEHYGLPRPVIRARYIDFSASFRRDSDDSTANAGGTWDFMAPEQMRIHKDLNTPTFASDVWSLGITLLSLMAGGSPYTAACGNNVFMLREAIKSGDPLSFARMSPKVQKRMAAAQDFVDCCRLSLHKDRERRATASAWKRWLAGRELGARF